MTMNKCKVKFCPDPVYRAKWCLAHWKHDQANRLANAPEVKRRCSNCHERGHTRQTCGVKREKEAETVIMAAFRKVAEGG